MKSRIVTLLAAMMLFAALAITVTAQQSPTNDAKNPGDAQASTSFETWTDPESGLMWARKDEGSDVKWDQANKYCAGLSLGGQSDWRLPSSDELLGIYDERETAWSSLGQQYHIAGGIALTSSELWSATQNGSKEAWLVSFNQGKRYSLHIGGLAAGRERGTGIRIRTRALCVRRASPAPPTAIATSSISASPDDPAAPHADGVYLLSKGPDGSVRLTKLPSKEPKIERHVGKAFLTGAATFGAGATHGQAVLEGPHAEIATAESSPVFYDYYLTRRGFPGARLTLAKFEMKKDQREINVMEFRASGAETGENAESVVALRSEQIGPGIVKLTPVKALPVGEYAVQADIGRLFFDFGIRAGQ